MEKLCKFDRSWAGKCDRPVVQETDYCTEHLGLECVVCKAQATRECPYTGQFVCGYPLCDDCEGWEDTTKPSGNWHFSNHRHRRKEKKDEETDN